MILLKNSKLIYLSIVYYINLNNCLFQGDFDFSKLKVLYFIMNFVALVQKKRVEELIKLREENERLKKRVEVLEEFKGQV